MESETTTVDLITNNGQETKVIGAIVIRVDPYKVKVKHLRQLARLTGWDEIAAWYQEHAGVSLEQFDELNMFELMDITRRFNEELRASVLPKANTAR